MSNLQNSLKVVVYKDPAPKKYRAVVLDAGGHTHYTCIRSSRQSAKWNADQYVAYNETPA